MIWANRCLFGRIPSLASPSGGSTSGSHGSRPSRQSPVRQQIAARKTDSLAARSPATDSVPLVPNVRFPCRPSDPSRDTWVRSDVPTSPDCPGTNQRGTAGTARDTKVRPCVSPEPRVIARVLRVAGRAGHESRRRVCLDGDLLRLVLVERVSLAWVHRRALIEVD